MALTQKQENFCLEYIKCGNASEAYRKCYNAKNMKEQVINNKASLMLQKGEIRVRIDSLNLEASNDAVMSLEDRKKWLTELIKHNDTEQKRVFDNDKLKALDLLNKMESVYVYKQEHSGTLSLKDFVEQRKQ